MTHGCISVIVRKLCQEGQLKEAVHILDDIFQHNIKPRANIYAYLLQGCIRMKDLEEGQRLHAFIIKSGYESNIFLENFLMDMYSSCGSVLSARQVFDNMPEQNLFSWTAIISAYVKHEQGEEAIILFQKMQNAAVVPDRVIFIFVLKACANLSALQRGKQVHVDLIEAGLESDLVVGSTVVEMYAKCGSIEHACQVFNRMCLRDVVSWNVMIAAYTLEGFGKEALLLYQDMEQEQVQPNKSTYINILRACACLAVLEQGLRIHISAIRRGFELDVFVGSTLIDMYAKCGSVEDAREVFDQLYDRNVVSWNAMIAGYTQQGLDKEAFELFKLMQQEGGEPDNATFVSILKSCASLTALEWGKQVHASIIKTGYESVIHVGSTVVDMYSKCGKIMDAHQVFAKMLKHDVIAWNAMIAGYAQQGIGKEALKLFEQMQQSGLKPNKVTFGCVLSACSHGGLLEECCHYFDSMIQNHGFMPSTEHYASMVDILGRAGHLDEAQELIDRMPVQPDAVMWLALLGACRSHVNAVLGICIFEHVIELEPDSSLGHVLLSNVYAAAGMWEKVMDLENSWRNV